jgi:glutathione S-transferase
MPMPDEHVHPVATGVAKDTVDAHQAEQEIVFWSSWVGLGLLKLE